MLERKNIPTYYVEELNKLSIVEKATTWVVNFTPEFKAQACKEYLNGKSMLQVFIDAGLNVELLGRKRIDDFRNRVCAISSGNQDFEDKRKSNSRKETQSTTAELEKKILKLEHQIEYLKQENDFLKKIQLLEKNSAKTIKSK